MQPISRYSECLLFDQIFKDKEQKIEKKAISIERISNGYKMEDPFENQSFDIWVIKNGKLMRRKRKGQQWIEFKKH